MTAPGGCTGNLGANVVTCHVFTSNHITLNQSDIKSLLGPQGEFSRRIPGFVSRAQQTELAQDIWRALCERRQLFAEAGTGTGKTCAYLIPAMLHEGRTLVSTGTKTLQDQSFYRDLPMVRDAVNPSRRLALLKGRRNYLCPFRLDKHLKTTNKETSADMLSALNRVREWYAASATGDINEVLDVERDARLLGLITSTADNCLGNECPKLNECPLYIARARAFDADIVVINHHLLFADIALQDDNLTSLLPVADNLIIDEAHQLADIAPQFFGAHVSSAQFADLCRDCRTELALLGDDDPTLASHVNNVDGMVDRLRGAIAGFDSNDLEALLSIPEISDGIECVDIALADLVSWLDAARVRSRALANCHHRAVRLSDSFALLTEPNELRDDYAHWVQLTERGFVVHLTPLAVADQLGAHVTASGKAWVFTSATLTVNGRFDHIKTALGLPDADERCYESPFNYARQVKGWLPAELPRPGDDAHTRALVASCLPVIAKVRGRAFFLFTSYRALNVAAACLVEQGINCLVQGQMSRPELLERFRSIERCVLLATYSFWEGVDVRGANLQCVIIDKLPFANPEDPLARARASLIRANGGNAFTEYLVPDAAIRLRQGFGRLVREEGDQGLFILGDPRIATRDYGAVFMSSLPAITWLDDRAAAIDYVAALALR